MFLKNATLYMENKISEHSYLRIADGKIAEIGDMCRLASNEEGLDLQGQRLVPGFIDQHTHGAGGADAMDASQSSLQTITETLAREGTTSFLATTITASLESTRAALEAAGTYQRTAKPGDGANLLGVHLEGPFLNSQYKGAHDGNYILPPDPELVVSLQQGSGNLVKMMTYAIEKDENFAFLHTLFQQQILPSCGHTAATFEQVEACVGQGLNCLTHFHNAMTPHHHRDPGVVTAGFCLDSLFTEVISDGVHLHPDVVRTIFRVKGRDRIILITDSMRAKGLPDGDYDLGGQKVIKRGAKCTLTSGTLAGSVLSMDAAVRNIAKFSGCSLFDAVRMASANPARHLGIFDTKGSIAPGKDADLVVLDEEARVALTLVGGEIAYCR